MADVVYLTPMLLARYQKQRGSAIFVTTHEFRVIVKGITITVPAGFETDFGSVPRLVRWAVSVVDGLEGSLVHDFLYRVPGSHTRAWSDEVMTTLDIGQMAEWRREVKYQGVRAFGQPSWDNARKGTAA